MTDSPLVTVFTATYNRAHTLHRTWESLKGQTYRHFEWLVIDDGSTDGTQQLMSDWEKQADFSVRYLRFPKNRNSGKHRAWNRAVTEARGELFIALDSDDACVPEALAFFVEQWKSLGSKRDSYAYVAALCRDQDGNLRGTRFPTVRNGGSLTSNHLEIHWKYKVRGDKWECFRTDVMRHYPLPEPERPGSVPEGIMLARIARRYVALYVNRVLRVYYDDGVGASLVNTPDPRRHAWGKFLNESEALWAFPEWHARAPLEFVLLALRLNRNIQLLHIPAATVRAHLPSARSRLLQGLFMLPGRFLGAYERLFKINASGNIAH